MKRIVCHCSCGATSWSMDWETDLPGMILYEGIAGDCPQCDNRFGKREPFVRQKPVLVKNEDTNDFTTMMEKRKEQHRQNSGKGKPRGRR